MIDKTLRLQGLEYLKEFEGCTADDLPRQYIRRIKETQILMYTIEKGTPEEVIYNIFKRINTGGLMLEAQEIRHALYHGRATHLIKELAQSPYFLDATQHRIKTGRMEDCEFVTRYLAFSELDYKKDYKGNIDSFLIKVLKRINDKNNYNDDQITNIRIQFEQIMKTCHDLFGKYAFCKVSKEYRRGPINKAIFEMWTYCILHLSPEERKKLVQNKALVLEQFIDFLQEGHIVTAIKAGDKYSVIHRIECLQNMIEEILHD